MIRILPHQMPVAGEAHDEEEDKRRDDAVRHCGIDEPAYRVEMREVCDNAD